MTAVIIGLAAIAAIWAYLITATLFRGPRSWDREAARLTAARLRQARETEDVKS